MPRFERHVGAGSAPALRLALARSLAWALLFGGWLVLGALGRQQLPLAAGGLLPVALWLAALGAALALASRRSWSPTALRRTLSGAALAAVLAAAVAGSALAGPAPAIGLLALAVAWAALLVAASLAVRLLRHGATRRPPPPALPALAGAALAWAWAGEPAGWSAQWLATPSRHGVAVAGVALALLLLLPRRASPVSACRAGLFDCALALAPLQAWRRPALWPQATAALAMLPMMATLALMADWCGAAGFSPLASTAAHLAAMLAPALLLRAWGATGRVPISDTMAAAVTAALLVLGGLALARPGIDGLMSAGLLHGLAWGLAWSTVGAWPQAPAEGTCASGPPRAGPGRAVSAAARPAFCAAAMVLALGAAIAQWGLAALAGVHAVLATLGAAGALALAWQALAALSLPRQGITPNPP
ncbi:MAG: hypothetical protein JNL87_12305 [Burkholderiaceae bacterium]|nr:hypothetical protein [Burkholderiaceae bacterium]